MIHTVSQIKNQKNPIEHIVTDMPKSYRRVVDYLIVYLNNHRDVYPTQERIARECGLSRRHVSRIVKWLHLKGMIIKKRVFGYFNRSRCYYRIGSLLAQGLGLVKNVSIVMMNEMNIYKSENAQGILERSSVTERQKEFQKLFPNPITREKPKKELISDNSDEQKQEVIQKRVNRFTRFLPQSVKEMIGI